MRKIVYHGSVSVIEKPEYGKGSRQNDYGCGFYCTEDLDLAKERACAKNYQRLTGYTFSHIHQAVPINELLGMYPTLHEADITKFAGIMLFLIKTKRKRKNKQSRKL